MDKLPHFPLPVTRDQLLPSAQAEYDKLVKKAGKKLPIKLVGVNVSQDAPLPLFVEDDGKVYVSVTDDRVRWTSQYVKRYRMQSDHEITDPAFNDQYVVKALEEIAIKLGIKPLPQIRAKNGFTGSAQSREGNYYVFLDPELSPATAIAAGVHELGHIKKGDTAPEAIAALHNKDENEAYRAQELRADTFVTKFNQAEALIQYFQQQLQFFEKTAKENNVTLDEAMDVLDPRHPRLTDRIKALEDAVRLKKEEQRAR